MSGEGRKEGGGSEQVREMGNARVELNKREVSAQARKVEKREGESKIKRQDRTRVRISRSHLFKGITGRGGPDLAEDVGELVSQQRSYFLRI